MRRRGYLLILTVFLGLLVLLGSACLQAPSWGEDDEVEAQAAAELSLLLEARCRASALPPQPEQQPCCAPHPLLPAPQAPPPRLLPPSRPLLRLLI